MRRSQLAARVGARRARFSVSMIALLACAPAVPLSACSSAADTPTRGSESVGSVGLELQAGSVTLNTIKYTILGNGFARIDYLLDVSNSTSIQAIIGGIPAGAGYTLTLSGVDAGGSGATCTGETTFDIIAGQTTTAPIQLECRVPSTTGSVTVNGSVNVCPKVDGISLEPAQTTVGHTVLATSFASDLDQGPSPLSYVWSTSSGSVTPSADSTAATVLCTVPGPLTLTLTVSDGDCTDTASQVITCAADGASAPTADDPNTPGDDRAGYVACGYVAVPTCGPGTFCCAVTDNGDAACASNASECPDQIGAVHCDGPEDCPAGDFCVVYKETSCTPADNAGFYYGVKCHTSADCPGGASCDGSGNCAILGGSPL
jgi:hypothetical protein